MENRIHRDLPNIQAESQRILRNKETYRQRNRTFQINLVNKLTFLGYFLIILQYIKYGTTVWSLILRCMVQSFLSNPFPNRIQMQGLTAGIPRLSTFIANDTPPNTTNGNDSNINNSSRLGDTTTTLLIGSRSSNGIPMPGAFPESSATPDLEQGERPLSSSIDSNAFSMEDFKIIKEKIQKLLFHGSFTLNLFVVVLAIIFPKDFIGKMNDNHLNGDLRDIPSPYNHDDGLIRGELRATSIFLQLIGEPLPRNNFAGNFGMISFDFFILISQFLLFSLTCYNFSEFAPDETIDNTENDIDGPTIDQDGYTGHVFLTTIDISKIVDLMI
ncbi:Gld1p NDAI_0A04780 [Naumovozyma dairenensis CBS 421]|uniref:DUF1746 domain-containing protein n=1 Tax=Naumovozyma dairenensis (strain ATCC 10597 / BCRC 20456 / CBS 421 / NBRC 0211 / NRRL Y-12639) TaxID=1071378 RepID=G0W496_NAUDC|nr:hypothetical protein NDAI_0A04780 [Naumovozyma dairenensis CBS 421]CCD22634.1 hypothetical protein NDAI_0A04780 [Naumovozyma dairenensis CBS 421]